MAGLNSWGNADVDGDYVFSVTAEDFGIIEASDASIDATGEDEAYDPATGDLAIFGMHTSGKAERTLTMTTLRNEDYTALEVGGEITLAMAVAIAGHTFSSCTHIVRGISESVQFGKLMKSNIRIVTIPYSSGGGGGGGGA